MSGEADRYGDVPMLRLDTSIRRYRGLIRVATSQAEDVLELSDVAGWIFLRIDGTRSVRDIGRELAQQYDIDEETACADTLELLTDLAKAGAITIRSA